MEITRKTVLKQRGEEYEYINATCDSGNKHLHLRRHVLLIVPLSSENTGN